MFSLSLNSKKEPVPAAVIAALDGRSREGRFLRQAERELLDQIGGEPGFAQRALVRRAARLMLAAEKVDGHLTATITSNDARTLGELNRSISDALADLGLNHRLQAGEK
jgi:hypothetical protein